MTLGPQATTGDGGTTDVEAQDLFFRANAVLAGPNVNREVFERAGKLLLRAIERDSGYARPHALLSIAYVNDFVNHWSDDHRNSLDVARRYGELAIEKGPNDPFSHAAFSLVLQLQKDPTRGLADVERALALDPNNAMAIAMRAMLDIQEGNALAAIPRIERAMRLDPAFAHGHMHHLANAYLLTDRYETAATLYKERILMVPNTDMSRAFLASALGHLGEVDEARRVWAELMT